MEISTYFYKDLCLFGSYPEQKDIEYLENQGVELILNLTTENDNLIPYQTSKIVIKYPIQDTKVPKDNLKFVFLILFLESYVKSGKKIFIHCRGGHGRSALVSAALLCRLENISTDESIQKISESHNTRIKMNPKHRDVICPNSKIQRHYLRKIFQPLYFSKCVYNYEKNGFSNFSCHYIDVPGVGIFHNSESAYQALKNSNDLVYISKLMNCKNPRISKLLGEKYSLIHGELDTDTKINLMEYILRLKFSQNKDVKEKLLMTGFRPIINHNKLDRFWGDGDGSGENQLGKILEKIREEYYNS
jgi:ribA/ribD-fused uncharacterized protein